jgi:ribosomal protein L30E
VLRKVFLIFLGAVAGAAVTLVGAGSLDLGAGHGRAHMIAATSLVEPGPATPKLLMIS